MSGLEQRPCGPVHLYEDVSALDLPAHGMEHCVVRTEAVSLLAPQGSTYRLVDPGDKLTGSLRLGDTGVGVTVNAFVSHDPQRLWEQVLLEHTAGYLRTLNRSAGLGDSAIVSDTGLWGRQLHGNLCQSDGTVEPFCVLAASGEDWVLRLTAFGVDLDSDVGEMLQGVLADAVVTTPRAEAVLSGTNPGWAGVSVAEKMGLRR